MAREITQVVELDQPRCIKTWGISNAAGLCSAHLAIVPDTLAQKCWNTRKTCTVPGDYAAGERYLVLPGTTADYASTPDSAALDITGDIDIVAYVRATDWTPATGRIIVARRASAGAAGVTCYVLYLSSTGPGQLHLIWSDGATVFDIGSTVNFTVADSTDLWVRATLDVNNGAAGNTVNFYTSTDGKTWTAFGAAVTTGGVTSIRAGTEILEVGSQFTGTSGWWLGRIYYVEIRNGIGGPPVAVFDINDAERNFATTIRSSRTGELWTINSSVNPLTSVAAAALIGFHKLRFVRNQSGVQKDYGNAVASINGVSTTPGTLNLAGMDGRSEDLLGQREEVSINLDNDLGSDDGVDPYRLERMTGQSSMKDIVLPGTSGNRVSTPNHSSNQITGDITIRCLVALDDWTPSSIATIFGKWSGTTLHAYKLSVLTDGKLRMSWSTDGTSGGDHNIDSTVALPTQAAGSYLWIFGALDVNNGAAGHDVAFGYSSSFNPRAPVTPTVLGPGVITTAGVTSIFNAATELAAGGETSGTAGLWSGKVRYADAANVFLFAATSPVTVMDPQDQVDGATSWVGLVPAQTWTINQSGSPAARMEAVVPPYDPYTVGTRWGKWLARNPYHVGYATRVYEGTVGQTTAEMSRRSYLTKGIDGPTNGRINWTLRDSFDRVTARKATCPTPNSGELLADMTGSPATFTLFPTGVGSEYSAAGYVCIGEEIIQYTRSVDVMTVVARGALGTTQENHNDEDLVQQVEYLNAMTAKDIVYRLLTVFAGVPTAWIDSAMWTAVMSEITELYTGILPKPTPVAQLLGELEEIVGFSVFPDVSTGLIDIVPLRPAAPVAVIDDETWLVQNSLKIKRLDLRRVSRCMVHYGQRDPTKDLEEQTNYHSRFLYIDAASESANEYGAPSLKEIFSRWIPQFGRAFAEAAAQRIVFMFRDPPLQVECRVPAPRAVAANLGLSSPITIRTADGEGFTGLAEDRPYSIVRMERDAERDECVIRAMETRFTNVTIDKTIWISVDTLNFNFRNSWSALFGTPVAGDTAKVILLPGIFVGGGSTSGSSFAFDVGTWPSGVTLQAEINGEILPQGGGGGNGGNVTVDGSIGDCTAIFNGSDGGPGAPGFRTAHAITVSGSGIIRGGWPGGGGGTAARCGPPTFSFWAAGGQGGGARGFPGGNPGAAGIDNGGGGIAGGPATPPIAGNPTGHTSGNKTTQGTGANGYQSATGRTAQILAGSGGAGNAAGGTATFLGAPTSGEQSSAGAAGARGTAITGNSLITFSSWTGTVDGPTTG